MTPYGQSPELHLPIDACGQFPVLDPAQRAGCPADAFQGVFRAAAAWLRRVDEAGRGAAEELGVAEDVGGAGAGAIEVLPLEVQTRR